MAMKHDLENLDAGQLDFMWSMMRLRKDGATKNDVQALKADVMPVVHAHWYMRGGRACCSNCNVKSLWGSDWDGCKNHEREFVSAKSNYCPNCGAKMDEEEHDNV